MADSASEDQREIEAARGDAAPGWRDRAVSALRLARDRALRREPDADAATRTEAAGTRRPTGGARDPKDGGGDRETRRSLWRVADPFSFSTLVARIVALNAVALALLVGGVLYLSQFRAGLIDLKIASLKTEADLIAVTIAEAAGEPATQRYNRIVANEVLRRLALPTGLRAQLYDRGGRLTGDTRTLFINRVEVEVDPIEGGGADGGFLGAIEDLYDRASALFSEPLETYQETPPAGISRLAEVYRALEGESASAQRRNSEDELILSVAVPVQRVKTVMGAVVLSTEGGDIAEIVREERIAILQVFIVAFGATLLVSLVLAQTIARPIRALARAAEKGGGEDGRPLNPAEIDIPDFTRRGDEIGHLSGAMRRMTRALYDRIAAIETFAADVAHEIKNPLTSLGSAVQSLQRAPDEEKRRELLAVLASDIRRLDRLVTDISNASRLDAELVRQQRERFDLASLLKTTAEVSESKAEKVGARIALGAGVGAMPMYGLEDRLAQVFLNLLDNALSFSERGQTVTIAARACDLDDRPAYAIDVIDEGPGVPPENLESVFGRFYSERPQKEGFGNHSGLGLSICRQIVEAHGGRIWAENRTDRSGAVFRVVLPR